VSITCPTGRRAGSSRSGDDDLDNDLAERNASNCRSEQHRTRPSTSRCGVPDLAAAGSVAALRLGPATVTLAWHADNLGNQRPARMMEQAGAQRHDQPGRLRAGFRSRSAADGAIAPAPASIAS
jgi:hypothetical protein